MKEIAVIYKSKYGGAKQYAGWLAAALDADLYELGKHTVSEIADYRLVIYGAGLYAGTINGFSDFTSIFKAYPNKKFILFIVGFTSAENTKAFKDILDKSFTPEMHAKIKAFYLRGGIDYKKLSVLHRIMMFVFKSVIARKKSETLTGDDRALLSSYGKVLSFFDEAALEPVLTYVSSILNAD